MCCPSRERWPGFRARVVLAVNERPALNDVTEPEALALLTAACERDALLETYVDRGLVSVISTGNGTPGIDLRRVAPAVNDVRADLVVLEGQGRAIESTWNAVLERPALRVATIKSPLVAKRLGREAFDPVVDVRRAGEVPPVVPGVPPGT